MSTETLSIRIDSDTKDRLDRLAQQTRRSKSFLAAQAISAYLEDQAWQIGQVHKGIEDCDAGRVVPHEDVKDWLQSWGSKDELAPPR